MLISNDKKCVEKINTTLKNGGIIAFVTDTVWGIGCLPNNKKAVEKIFSTKKKVPNAYLYVAEIQLKEGYPKSALQSIDKLLTINPKHVDALEVKEK